MLDIDNWLRPHGDKLLLRVYVQPGGKKSEFLGEYNGVLKIRLAAVPVDGQANQALLVFLAKQLNIRQQQLQLDRGEKSRHKCLLIRGVEFAHCQQRLLAVIKPVQA